MVSAGIKQNIFSKFSTLDDITFALGHNKENRKEYVTIVGFRLSMREQERFNRLVWKTPLYICSRLQGNGEKIPSWIWNASIPFLCVMLYFVPCTHTYIYGSYHSKSNVYADICNALKHRNGIIWFISRHFFHLFDLLVCVCVLCGQTKQRRAEEEKTIELTL